MPDVKPPVGRMPEKTRSRDDGAWVLCRRRRSGKNSDLGVEVENAIRTRRTVKAFGPEPVDRAILEELLELARWAPNHHLTNPWRFRVVGPGRPRY